MKRELAITRWNAGNAKVWLVWPGIFSEFVNLLRLPQISRCFICQSPDTGPFPLSASSLGLDASYPSIACPPSLATPPANTSSQRLVVEGD